jgi:hypothetical protein
MTVFIAHIDTACDYTLHFTITHTLMSTVTSSLLLLGSGFQWRTLPASAASFSQEQLTMTEPQQFSHWLTNQLTHCLFSWLSCCWPSPAQSVISVGLTKGLDTPEFKNAWSVYCNEKTGKETQLVWHEASCFCQRRPSGCTWCSNLNIDGKYEKLLTSSIFIYIVLRLITMIIIVEIKSVRGGYAQ